MSNVVKVPPRREIVSHKGLHGFVEYHPARKLWSWTLKLVYTIKHTGEARRKEEAALEAKTLMEKVAGGTTKNVRSID